MKLNINNTVSIPTEGVCTILEQLGKGGQVYYKVHNNKEYALK